MKVLQVFVYCQFMMMCSLSAQSAKLASSIDFFFDTIMVGQPVYFNFTLKNTQTNPVAVFYEPEGKDWNELGRDESFDVNFCSSSGSTLQNRVAKLKNAIMISRYLGYKDLNQGDQLSYTHWLGDWVKIEEPGEYRVECSKDFVLKYNEVNTRQVFYGSTSFVVIPRDSSKMESFISDLWDKINTEEPNLLLLETFIRIDSKSIIPYLQEITAGSTDYNSIVKAIQGLAKFKEDKMAFGSITAVFNGEVDFFSTDAKETTSQHNNLLRKAFYGIIQFEDAKCIPFLLEHKNHDDSYLRTRIIKELYARDKKIAQPIVLEYLKDEDQRVRATAEMYQKLMNNQ